eukprot:sb/3478618/
MDSFSLSLCCSLNQIQHNPPYIVQTGCSSCLYDLHTNLVSSFSHSLFLSVSITLQITKIKRPKNILIINSSLSIKSHFSHCVNILSHSQLVTRHLKAG